MKTGTSHEFHCAKYGFSNYPAGLFLPHLQLPNILLATAAISELK